MTTRAPSTYGDPEDASFIQSERPAPHVLLIRIAREAKRNALSNPMVVELGRLLAEAAQDVDVRCVVLTGGDTVFSAGADLTNMRTYGVAAVFDPRRMDAWRTIENFPKPMIAAVNGVAMGAGNELVLCCDFIIAGENARFGQPEVIRGGMAGDGGTQRLPRKIGPQAAAYMLLTGEPIDAATALRFGYTLEVHPPAETVGRAVALAKIIATRSPLSVQFTKKCIHAAVGATPENGLAMERMLLQRVHGTADRAEGLAAFDEKRDPHFTGVE